MSSIAPTASLAELAAEQPARTRLFERLHLDYCCGGSRSLAAACADRGLDAATVARLLDAIEGEASAVDPVEDRDWRRAGIAELCDHIVSVHHERLRAELPRIAGLLATVVRVHGEGRPELEITERAFAVLRAELEPHLAEEEEYLFPACRALAGEAAGASDFDVSALERHRAEHAGVGSGLAALRELAGGYDDAEALCSTHRALLAALRDFESDLHRHVHEENNLLFPRVLELAAGGGGRG
jgi:regulator of cell morphogenesis and NO signaling